MISGANGSRFTMYNDWMSGSTIGFENCHLSECCAVPGGKRGFARVGGGSSVFIRVEESSHSGEFAGISHGRSHGNVMVT